MSRIALSAALTFGAVGIADAARAETPATSLQQGARGDSVRALQQALLDRGVTIRGGADGVFGAATTEALRRFQTANGLSVTGIVDAATAAALGLPSDTLATSSTNSGGLARGARGAAVRQLQERLIALGYSVAGGADGIFGAGTAAAVQAFQTANGLAATGVVDAATAAALAAATPSTAPPTTTTVPATTVPASVPPVTTMPPAPTTTTPTTGTIVGLAQGARGELVRQLQQQLAAAKIAGVGPADGIFGAKTTTALKAFQTSIGLPATGAVDQATATALATAVTQATTTTVPATTVPATTVPPTIVPATTAPASNGAQGATSPLLGLQLGASGDAVKTLQRTLVQAGVQVRGGADGKFGLATQGALKQYQQLAGLATSGIVDAPTASALASGRSVTGGTPTLNGLKAGAIGGSVKALQQALIAAGVPVRGGADGVFGPATAQALKTFQTSQGLQPTGVVDDATVAALTAPKPIVTPPVTGTPAAGYAVYGEKGARVTALQTALASAGIAPRGGIDGDFGPGTSAAVMEFQRRNGLRVTGVVDDATGARLGLGKQDVPKPVEPASVRLDVFPVQGRCSFVDSWLARRSGGRLHQGVDIIAPQGKAIYAATAGTITKIYTDYPGSLAGNGVRLTQPDGTYFFYAHMVSLAPGIVVDTPVRAGQVIGYVGSTGSSGANHLHFEIHPLGGAAINPFPIVKAIDGCGVTELRQQ
jgi:peptidoglycan hydrolase-like protein with peptidoglycan-binding domain